MTEKPLPPARSAASRKKVSSSVRTVRGSPSTTSTRSPREASTRQARLSSSGKASWSIATSALVAAAAGHGVDEPLAGAPGGRHVDEAARHLDAVEASA